MVRRARGMTLVEVLVALLVATVGLLGTLALLGTLVNGTSFSRQATEASVLVQDKIEEINALGHVTTVAPLNPADGPAQGSPEIGLDAFGRLAVPPGPFTRTTTWKTVTDAAGVRRHVDVVVSWTDALNGAHQVTGQVERNPNP